MVLEVLGPGAPDWRSALLLCLAPHGVVDRLDEVAHLLALSGLRGEHAKCRIDSLWNPPLRTGLEHHFLDLAALPGHGFDLRRPGFPFHQPPPRAAEKFLRERQEKAQWAKEAEEAKARKEARAKKATERTEAAENAEKGSEPTETAEKAKKGSEPTEPKKKAAAVKSMPKGSVSLLLHFRGWHQKQVLAWRDAHHRRRSTRDVGSLEVLVGPRNRRSVLLPKVLTAFQPPLLFRVGRGLHQSLVRPPCHPFSRASHRQGYVSRFQAHSSGNGNTITLSKAFTQRHTSGHDPSAIGTPSRAKTVPSGLNLKIWHEIYSPASAQQTP